MDTDCGVEGGHVFGDKGSLTLGGEHTMEYVYGTLPNCIIEPYLIVLINVTNNF